MNTWFLYFVFFALRPFLFPSYFLSFLEMSTFLSAAYRRERTWNNFKPDVMKSGLQKYIRRGNVEKALYCAGELDLFKKCADARAEGLRTNFLHRLMVIFIEDVGIGALGDWARLDALFTLLWIERKSATRDKTRETVWITEIVRKLCAAQKSRSCSHVRAVCDMRDGARVVATAAYPAIVELQTKIACADSADFEVLCTNLRDALLARSWDAVYWAKKIADSDVKVREYRKQKPVWRVFRILENVMTPTLSGLHGIAMRWYSELEGLKEAELAWMLLIVALNTNAPKNTNELDVGTCDDWAQNRSGFVCELDAFVLDRHTAAGRGKSLVEFALVGAHVENESPLVVQMHKDFYNDMKRYAEGEFALTGPAAPAAVPAAHMVQRESELYEFHVRTQLNTGKSKSDVYVATRVADGVCVIVKGPLPSETAARNMLEFKAWKETHGLPTIATELVHMIPDRWSGGIPLGLRNSVDRTKLAPFLVFECLVPAGELKRKMHESKVWPATEVVDWGQVKLHLDIDALNDNEMRDYVRALCARWAWGVSDLADRNFLCARGRVYSIDEEYRGRDVNFGVELKKAKCSKVRSWIDTHYESLDFAKWWVPLHTGVEEKMGTLRNKQTCLDLFNT